jgi:hypothetical protein
MRSTVKKRSRSAKRRVDAGVRKSTNVNAAGTIRRMGDDWA